MFEEVRAGNLGVRLAATEEEVDAALALRYRVFFEEMGARPDARAAATRRDRDEYDAVADHLLVLDHDLGDGAAGVVGTYRLIRREAAARVGRFYTETEYDITPLFRSGLTLLELGRSCVAPDYRTRGTLQLLWRGIASYVFGHGIDLMFGCASLHGTDPDALAAPLTYLASYHLAPPELRPRALPERYVDMLRLPPEQLDTRAVLADLPPLVKGYLRLGGVVGDGAVIDAEFNTTDVCILVRTAMVTDKYLKHYERQVAAAGGSSGPEGDPTAAAGA
jgi:putative hemolysin